ncbi:hypothetical protein glysoja_038476 [Glycine soja]|uniref:Uncharacterized protein n=2 Tax=Glycine soja TaxID=3848 RepID=A0A0B2PMH6_GLYSO|nr:hypothetical protein glysoja_038476 [Glycine soja]
MEFYCRKMEFSFGLPAQKEGNVTDVKKPERKNEEIPKVSPYFRNHYGNNGGNGEENQGKVATRKIVLALPAYCPQKLPTVVDLKEPMRTNKEAYNNIKIGHDLQSSGNEIGTGNTTTNNGKRTSIKHEEVQKVSPYFWNDYGKKGDNGKENGDEIAIETVKSKRKRRLKNRLKKYELHGDNEKKNGSESCCYGSDRNGDETAIGKIKPKQKRRLKSHEAQGDNEKKVDTELCYGSQENGDEIPIEKIKSKRKKRSKKCKPQGENKENIDPELSCYGCDIGFVEDKLLTDGKIKSKEKKKKSLEDKLWENIAADEGDDAEISKYILKKREPQGDEEKIDPEFFCYGCNIGFGKDELLAGGKIKSKEKKKKTVEVEDELQENIVHNGTAKKTKVKPLDIESMSEPIALPTYGDLKRDKLEEDGSEVQINHRPGHASYAVSVVLTSASGDCFEDKLKENGNGLESISIEFKKSKFNCQKTVEESVKVRKVSPYFQSDNVKNKVFADKLLNKRNDAETSNVKPMKMESVVQKRLEVNISGEKSEQQGQDSHIDSVVVTVASGDLEEVQEIGSGIETIKVELMKKRKSNNPKTAEEGDKIRKVFPYM